MADALGVQIAKEVTEKLNGHTFSEAFTAVRRWRPLWDLKDLSTLRVSVVLMADARERATRKDVQRDVTVNVAVQKKLALAGSIEGEELDVEEVDALVALAEEIAEFCEDAETEWTAASCLKALQDPLVDYEDAVERRAYTGLISLTFRAWS